MHTDVSGFIAIVPVVSSAQFFITGGGGAEVFGP